jgi:outer membrane protein
LKAKLNQALKRIGAERGYAFILNTDGESVPYVDSSMGENITAVVIDALR